jgi:hypothetical protein
MIRGPSTRWRLEAVPHAAAGRAVPGRVTIAPHHTFSMTVGPVGPGPDVSPNGNEFMRNAHLDNRFSPTGGRITDVMSVTVTPFDGTVAVRAAGLPAIARMGGTP